jgi:hypothetical protein
LFFGTSSVALSAVIAIYVCIHTETITTGLTLRAEQRAYAFFAGFSLGASVVACSTMVDVAAYVYAIASTSGLPVWTTVVSLWRWFVSFNLGLYLCTRIWWGGLFVGGNVIAAVWHKGWFLPAGNEQQQKRQRKAQTTPKPHYEILRVDKKIDE